MYMYMNGLSLSLFDFFPPLSLLSQVKTDPSSLSPLLADPDIRCHPYSQPLNSCFTEVDLLLFALQIAAAMDHLTSRNVREDCACLPVCLPVCLSVWLADVLSGSQAGGRPVS